MENSQRKIYIVREERLALQTHGAFFQLKNAHQRVGELAADNTNRDNRYFLETVEMEDTMNNTEAKPEISRPVKRNKKTDEVIEK